MALAPTRARTLGSPRHRLATGASKARAACVSAPGCSAAQSASAVDETRRLPMFSFGQEGHRSGGVHPPEVTYNHRVKNLTRLRRGPEPAWPSWSWFRWLRRGV